MFDAVLNNSTLYIIIAAILFIIVVIIVYGILPRLSMGGAFRKKQRRMSVIETLPLDSKNRLMLIRQDDREHLILLGATSGFHIESSKTTTSKGAYHPASGETAVAPAAQLTDEYQEIENPESDEFEDDSENVVEKAILDVEEDFAGKELAEELEEQSKKLAPFLERRPKSTMAAEVEETTSDANLPKLHLPGQINDAEKHTVRLPRVPKEKVPK